MTEACAAIVERDDPHLYATALFAPEPARSRLMVLYAFDCELSRATRSSKESMIPRMRLQWWRDTIDEAVSGAKPKAHEVAEPLSKIFRLPTYAPGLDPAPFHAMIDGHEAELSAPFAGDAYQTWAIRRFGGRSTAAFRMLAPDQSASDLVEIAEWVGRVLGAGFVMRTARGRAVATASGLVPDISGPQLAALARDDMPADLHRIFIGLATEAEAVASELHINRRNVPKPFIPALLPLTRERHVLKLVRRADFKPSDLDHIDRPFDGLRLAWRAATGRW